MYTMQYMHIPATYCAKTNRTLCTLLGLLILSLREIGDWEETTATTTIECERTLEGRHIDGIRLELTTKNC